MKPAKKHRLTILAVNQDKELEDGSIESKLVVQTTDKPIDEKAKPFPVNDVVLEKEAIKKANFKKQATTSVRNAANVGQEAVKTLDYWKEVKADKSKAKNDDNTISINDQNFTIDQVKEAFKSSDALTGISGNVNKTRVINEIKKLDDNQLDALLLELDK